MKEIFYKEKPVKVLKVLGSDDGYYWDYSIWFEYEGEKFYICNADSGSGWIPYFAAITRGEFERLWGDNDHFCWDINEDYVERLITDLLEKLGDQDSYEEREDDQYENW